MPFYQKMRRPHPLRGNRLRFSAPGHPGRRFELADQQLVDRGDQVINAMEAFKNDFRCITMDQRYANGGKSTGPVPVDNPWDAFADDQLGLNWEPDFLKRRPDVSPDTIEQYFHNLYAVQPDFVRAPSLRSLNCLPQSRHRNRR